MVEAWGRGGGGGGGERRVPVEVLPRMPGTPLHTRGAAAGDLIGQLDRLGEFARCHCCGDGHCGILG